MKTFEQAMFKLGQTEALCDELGEQVARMRLILDGRWDAAVNMDLPALTSLVDRWRASQAARGET